jgi:polyisoprenoid-binding protein YceI
MKWQIDGSHTNVGFTVRHMMVSNVRGKFDKVSGTVEFDPANAAAASADIAIDVGSITTQDAQRDGHLKSADFFEAEKFPQITFKSSKVQVIDKDSAKLHGDLSIRGVSKPVVLDVEFNGVGKNPWGNTVAGFSAKGKINRKDFGLNWNVALEAGGILVGEEIKLEIEAELNPAK